MSVVVFVLFLKDKNSNNVFEVKLVKTPLELILKVKHFCTIVQSKDYNISKTISTAFYNSLII